ncbi:MAG TPA: GNAT family N-acetyltransferase, partial [Gemmatimonadaceae bacterium]|nr:GNAT family N-acetyltransferase [Gemmatimonadaceae bacterium]
RLQALIDQSARGLSIGYYSPTQIEYAVRYTYGVDSQLIDDGTYFLVHQGDSFVAAGGWSKRRRLYGGDQARTAPDPYLDPDGEPAGIRAFFVHPDWARRGLARRLFEACERAAGRERFRSFELMSTLPGVPLYAALGFTSHERVDVPMADGIALPCIRMTKCIAPPGEGG